MGFDIIELEFNDGTMRLGSHISKQNTLFETISRVLTWKINCAQIYLGTSRGYSIVRAEEKDILLTRSLVEYAVFNVYVHACLLYNLNGATHIDDIEILIKHAKTDKQRQRYMEDKEKIPINRRKTINGLISELDLCASAFGTGVVVHIGSGTVKDKAIKRIAQTIETVLSANTNYNSKNRHLILENAAGEGNKIGSTLQEIKEIIDRVDKKYHVQLSVCIDTCHLFAAGDYNIEFITEVKRFINDFDHMIGIDKLKLLHLNDSKGSVGCKRDRHEDIGQGFIFQSEQGKKSLQYIVNFCNCNTIDMILETPGTHMSDIDLIYGL